MNGDAKPLDKAIKAAGVGRAANIAVKESQAYVRLNVSWPDEDPGPPHRPGLKGSPRPEDFCDRFPPCMRLMQRTRSRIRQSDSKSDQLYWGQVRYHPKHAAKA